MIVVSPLHSLKASALIFVTELGTPGEEGIITVTLNSTKLHDYGLTQTSVYLGEQLGDKVSPDHEIGVSTVLLPGFVGMTPQQKVYAPKMALSKETVDIRFDGKSITSPISSNFIINGISLIL